MTIKREIVNKRASQVALVEKNLSAKAGTPLPKCISMDFLGGISDKEPICQCRRHKRLGFEPSEDSLEEGMATHSTILAWRIPRTEEPGGLQFIGFERVRHNSSN